MVVSSFEEDLPKDSVPGSRYAELTAAHKALDVAGGVAGADLIISADTVVECDGHILEKPADAADARRMLALLSGRAHEVHTGVALATPAPGEPGGWAVHSFVESTTVVFDDLSGGEIDAYVASGEAYGKAGAYGEHPFAPAPGPLSASHPVSLHFFTGIQGMAAPFVRSISGCYFNVVGLPLHRLAKELRDLIDSGKLQL